MQEKNECTHINLLSTFQMAHHKMTTVLCSGERIVISVSRLNWYCTYFYTINVKSVKTHTLQMLSWFATKHGCIYWIKDISSIYMYFFLSMKTQSENKNTFKQATIKSFESNLISFCSTSPWCIKHLTNPIQLNSF